MATAPQQAARPTQPNRPKKNNKPRQNNGASGATNKPNTRRNNNNKPRNQQQGKPQRPANNGYDPYDNRSGGSAIITKPPVWGNETAAPALKNEPTGNNRNKRKNNRPKNKKNAPNNLKKNNRKHLEIPRKENGAFDFTDADLAEDTGLQVVSRDPTSEIKFADFAAYLEAQNRGGNEED